MGTDLSFIARQSAGPSAARTFASTWLFYHCSLHRLVAIELRGPNASYKGQMGLHLRWLDR